MPRPRAAAAPITVTKLSSVKFSGERSGGCAISACCSRVLDTTSQTTGAADHTTKSARPATTPTHTPGPPIS